MASPRLRCGALPAQTSDSGGGGDFIAYKKRFHDAQRGVRAKNVHVRAQKESAAVANRDRHASHLILILTGARALHRRSVKILSSSRACAKFFASRECGV